MMNFHKAEYNTHFFLGDPSLKPIWHWERWQRVLPGTDPLMNLARGKAAVRVTQYLPDGGGVVRFGRIGWNAAGHQKWSHGSPTNSGKSDGWNFQAMEVWAPHWDQCAREDSAPDVYLSIANEQMTVDEGMLSFNPLVILAVVASLAEREPAIVGNAVATLIKELSPLLVGYRRQPWGQSAGSGFEDAIQDMSSWHLFKDRSSPRGQVTASQIEQGWQIIGGTKA